MANKSKWKKYRILRKTGAIRSHVPKTLRWSKKNLRSMLNKQGRAIVKPAYGFGGRGVIRVRKTNGGRYEIRYERHIKKVSGFKAAYKFVKKKKHGIMIVQRHIRLAKIKNRPFDLRAMVQRKSRKSGWKITGKLAKVAGKRYIITNVQRSHGKVMSAKSAIRKSDIRGVSTKRILHSVDRISLLCALKLSRYYKSLHTVGMDIGVDRKGKVWVIEANFKPALSLFRKLKSKRAYRRILKYSRKWKSR